MRMGFKEHLRAEVVPGEATYVISERGITAFDDAQVAVVAPLLDGTRDFRSLVADASPHCSPRDVALAIGRLNEAELLTRDPVPARSPAAAAAAYWELAGAPGPLSLSTVRVRAVGGADARSAEQACTASGLLLADERDLDPGLDPGLSLGRDLDRDPGQVQVKGQSQSQGRDTAELTLVVCDNYLDPALADIDAEQRAAGTPWLLAKPHGTTPWIGPLFRPGDGPCWHCLSHRIAGHRGAETHLRRALGRPVAHPPAETPASLLLGNQLAVAECVKWLGGHRHPGQDGVLTFDTFSLTTQVHPLRARPQCTGCGDPGLVARRVLAPVTVSSRPKADLTGSGHRSATAEQTLRTYQHLISPVTGVVKAVQRDSRGPAGLNSFRAGHNHARGPRGLTGPSSQLRSESGGKGMTELDARVGALCESLERHSGMYEGDEPTVRASWREVADRAVHPADCLLYDPRQGMEPFDEDAPVDWTPVWSLTRGEHRLLPTALLYFDAPRTPGLGHVQADSNGNAAGSSPEDAIVQGFLELVERDAVALWWYNRTRHPAVDLDAFDEPWIDRMRVLHASLGREVWVLDVTSDFGVPTFAAVTRRTDKPAEDLLFGFGAHFDPKVALCRAIAEANQLMPAVVGVRADGTGYGCHDERLLRWWRTATTADHPYLLPDPRTPLRRPADFAYEPRTDLRDDIAAIGAAVRERGMELLVLDQTRPDIGLPVVKVIVPGMRHFWDRFAPGRLYDVPVRLGRLTGPTPYEDLNPVPLFL
ncbi:TOMM precursor leader peptide-binding protein [Streptomyces sp. NBC_00090]|uniref:TOMM precursor leader peptide-binding protein n=1 Tax=Streptomyces sp. NBC_00090 TaxID=2903619 RepID=UPI00324504ED